MPTTEQNKNMINRQTKVQEMRNSAADTMQTSGEITGASLTLHDDVMREVRADRANRGASKMAEDIGTTTGQLVQDPLDIRNRTRGVVNPEDVNALTKSARASNLGTLATQATQAEYNQGQLTEIIQAGANQLKAKAQQLQAEAERELAKADALMEALKFEQSEKEREFSEWATREQLKQSGAKGTEKAPTDESKKEYALGLLSSYGENEPWSFSNTTKDPDTGREYGWGTITNSDLYNRVAADMKAQYPGMSDDEIRRHIGVAPASKPVVSETTTATTTELPTGGFTLFGKKTTPYQRVEEQLKQNELLKNIQGTQIPTTIQSRGSLTTPGATPISGAGITWVIDEKTGELIPVRK